MLRILFFLIVLLLPIGASKTEWQDEYVTIYADSDSMKFGLAKQRRPIKASVYKFRKGRTLWLNGREGFLTAVTASTKLKQSLDGLLDKQRSITVAGRDLQRVTTDEQGQTLVHTMYVYREVERGIYIGFTLEKPTQDILAMIDSVYQDEPVIAAIVKRHYQENYVIRIVQADNFYSREDPPSIEDIMFAATLIGEKEQELLGIHDGNNYLAPLAEFYDKNTDYKILLDEFSNVPLSGQA